MKERVKKLYRMRENRKHMNTENSYNTLLEVYQQAVQFFLRYGLIRCFKYTNNRRLAEKIAGYSLAGACLSAGEEKNLQKLGGIVGLLTEIIAADPADGKKPKSAGKGQMLFAEKKIQQTAEALNKLNRSRQQILILHHIEMMSTNDLAMIYDKSIYDIISIKVNNSRSFVNVIAAKLVLDLIGEQESGNLNSDWIAIVSALIK